MNIFDFTTDKDKGNLPEFIEKEGKWFNYIKGLSTPQALDTSRFSVQGIGIAVDVESTIFTPPAPEDPPLGGGGGY